MIENYRKAIGSNVWHFCVNCSTWPAGDHIASTSREQVEKETLCAECVARYQIGDCDANGTTPMRATKCPVIVAGKECGRDLLPDWVAGYHRCSVGHRVLIVQSGNPKKSN